MIYLINMITMNGRPDPGVSSVSAYKSGPRQGSTSTPSFAELRNPTLTNSKINYDTNATANVPLLIRPWLDAYEKHFAEGSILFVNIDEKSHRLATVADLPTMNYIMENAHRTIAAPTQSMYTNCKSLQNFQKNGWNYYGLFKNDMMAESNLQKLLNVSVFGRTLIANIFGKLQRGDHVGLALVEMDTGAEYGGFMEPSGAILPSNIINKPGAGKPGIFQFVPTVNKRIVGRKYDAANPAAGDAIDYLVHYPIGVITSAVGRIPNKGQVKRALRSQTHYMSLPRVEILLI